MTLNQFLNNPAAARETLTHARCFHHMLCADGFSMSVQLDDPFSPNPVENCKVFEVGFPSRIERALVPYVCECDMTDDIPLDESFYHNVPRAVVEAVITSHGGIVGIQKMF